jgi:hypothetical protein
MTDGRRIRSRALMQMLDTETLDVGEAMGDMGNTTIEGGV